MELMHIENLPQCSSTGDVLGPHLESRGRFIFIHFIVIRNNTHILPILFLFIKCNIKIIKDTLLTLCIEILR